MELTIYDPNFIAIEVVDNFFSLIWTKRYSSYGDFQIEVPLEDGIPDWIRCDNYVTNSDDNEEGYYMIIDTIETQDNEDHGKSIIVSGKSLEYILNRRIVWEQTAYSNRKTSAIIQDLLNKSFISPSLGIRKMDNFVFELQADVSDLSTVSAEYTGDSIYTSVINLAAEDHYGISIRYQNDTRIFLCKMYKGVDRTVIFDNYKGAVIFSTDMDNLISSNYLESTEKYANVILAMGQGTGANRTRYILGTVSGFNRREYYKDARDVSTSAALQQRANEALKENDIKQVLEGEIISEPFIYGQDYFVGDIVEIQNSFGIVRKARIEEMIFSQDESGINIYPTVEIINEEE